MMLRLIRGAIVVVAMLVSFTAPVSAALVDVTLQQSDRNLNNGSLGTIDLTQGGAALDWIKPVGTDLTFAEKNNVTLLTLATTGAVFTPGLYTDDGYTFTWSGGDSNSVSGSTMQGSNRTTATQNVGFRVTFTAPAAGDYLLKWYSAGNNTQNFRLTGTLGAASDFQQVGTNVGTTSGNGAVDEFFWTVNFTADAPGELLTLDLVNTTTTSSAIAITGITVAAIPEPSTLGLWGIAAISLGFYCQRKRISRA